MGWSLLDFWQMTVRGKVKACILHVPGITFPPHYRIFNLLSCYTTEFSINFPAVKDVSASVFALEFTFPLPIRSVNFYGKIFLTAGK
jgi:hypothetical protein